MIIQNIAMFKFIENKKIYAVFSCNVVPHSTTRDSKTWNTSGIEGVHRFLGRTWRLIVGSPLADGTVEDGTVVTDEEPTLEQLRSLHKCIAKVKCDAP